MPHIAFFDFDGTITRKDTLWEFIRFRFGRTVLLTGIIRLLPALLLYKMKVIAAQDMKQRVLRYFFAGMPEPLFTAACQHFCRQRLPQLLRPLALEAIAKHRAEGHAVVVVTASPVKWVQPWAQTIQLTCIGSELEIKDDRITGNITGQNCNGEEKVMRIKALYNLDNYHQIYAYGDSKGDRPMLALAHHAVFRPFR